MDGHEPSPPASPWAPREPGDPPIEFELRSPAAAPPVEARTRPWGLIAGVGAVAAIVVAGVLFLARGGNDDDAAGLSDVPNAAEATSDDATTPATTATTATTAPTGAAATTEPAPTASTEPVVTTTEPAPLATVGPLTVTPGTFSFRAIGTATSTAAQQFVMRSTGAGVEVTVEAAVDAEGRMSTTTDADGVRLNMIFDVAGGVGYLGGDAFTAILGTTGAPWIAVNLDEYLKLGGQDLETLRAQMLGPASSEMIDGFEPTPLGLTEIDGETVMLYHLDLDAADLAIAQANAAGKLPSNVLEGMSQIDSMSYDFYVTEANTLRRMSMVGTAMGQSTESVYDFTDVPDGFTVALPDQADVELIDITKLAGVGVN